MKVAFLWYILLIMYWELRYTYYNKWWDDNGWPNIFFQVLKELHLEYSKLEERPQGIASQPQQQPATQQQPQPQQPPHGPTQNPTIATH